MKREICCAAIAAAVTMPAIDAQNRTADVSRSSIVVEGCLQTANASALPAGPPLGTPANPARAGGIANNPELAPLFILTDAQPSGGTAAGASAGSAVGTAGRARTRNADGTVTSEPADREPPKTYALVGSESEFAVHTGHQVQVSGTVAPPVAPNERTPDRPGGTQTGDPGAGGGTRSPNGNNSQGRPSAARSGTERLNVTSIRTVADSCTR
jgi:hypothetical protein